MNRLLGGIMLRSALSGTVGIAVALALVGFAPAASAMPITTTGTAVVQPASATDDGAAAVDLTDDIIPVPASAGEPTKGTRGDGSSRGTTATTDRAASTVHTLWISVVNVTSTSSDNTVGTLPTASNVSALVASVNAYWSAESGGAVTIKLGGFVERSQKAASCSASAVLAAEEANAFDGRFDNYRWIGTNEHLVVLTRESCGAVGSGTIGDTGGEIISGNGTDASTGIPVLLHEFGHNLGFGHAGSAICQATASFDGSLASFATTPTAAKCPTEEYGDVLDIMGYTIADRTPHLSSPQAVATGFLSDYVALGAGSDSRVVTLSSVGATSGTRAIEVTDPLSAEKYYIEYRTPTGRDANSWQFTRALASGDPIGSGFYKYRYGSTGTAGVVRVLRLLPKDGYSSTAVLATSPTTGANTSASKMKRSTHLAVGDSFTSTDGGFTVRVDSASAAAGAVVSFSPGSTIEAPPVTSAPAPDPVPGAEPIASHTTITLKPTIIEKGKAGSVRIVVKATGVGRPTGTLRVYAGTTRVKSYTLPSSKKGIVTLTLPKFTAAGKKSITVRYAAAAGTTPAIAGSTSPRKVLTVRR